VAKGPDEGQPQGGQDAAATQSRDRSTASRASSVDDPVIRNPLGDHSGRRKAVGKDRRGRAFAEARPAFARSGPARLGREQPVAP
jgi:hypothetical protein